MIRTLSGKLASVLLVLLLASGVFYVALTVATTQMHIKEVTQSLNRSLAADLVEGRRLLDGGRADAGALKTLFDMLMVVNPAIEVYLLDAEGRILAYSAAPEKIKRTRVSLGPIRDFLSGRHSLPIGGDDPRDAQAQKIFSAAPITQTGRLAGYLYVVLGGEHYDSVASMFETSWIMRISVGLAAASLVLVAVIGALWFRWLTRRLRRLNRTIAAFAATGATGALPLPPPPVSRGDEIDELTQTFRHMAARIDDQIRQLEGADALRRELITNVSHDLRTPLASLQGAIETLKIKDRTMDAAQKSYYLDLAHKHAQRVARLINDLFELATLESGDRELRSEPFSLAELVQDVALKFEPAAAEKGLRLKLDMPLNSSLVAGDIGLIERALTNLVDNAIKYTPSGGHIDIAVVGDGDLITTRVADSGPGIGADELERIFDRCYRGSRGRGDHPEGAGLGLAIARRIVERHGRRLEVESRPGVGTVFSFALPVAAMAPAAVPGA